MALIQFIPLAYATQLASQSATNWASVGRSAWRQTRDVLSDGLPGEGSRDPVVKAALRRPRTQIQRVNRHRHGYELLHALSGHVGRLLADEDERTAGGLARPQPVGIHQTLAA